MNTRAEQILANLRDRGARMTPQRLEIVRAIADDTRHPTVEQVHKAVCERFPTTSRATVYKTLELLKEAGELLEYEFNTGGNRYEAIRIGHHAHVVCDGCGRMEDIDLAGTDGSLLAQADAESSFRVWQQRIEFRGTCPDCEVSEGLERAAAD